ncbi:MAG: cytochrome c class [Gemmatimonadetes bacterium]|nr:cytochrome c class [Gemmatimonadota bacterium]
MWNPALVAGRPFVMGFALAGCATATLGSTAVLAQSAHAAANAGATFEVPAWAFPAPGTPAAAAPLDSVTLLHVPRSKAGFTQKRTRELFAVVDWRPETHPAMPGIVEHGRKPAVFACGYCHYPDGSGRPENATLAGLPVEYFVQQVADMRSRVRRSASQVPFRPFESMRAIADSVSDAEVLEAARYFASVRPGKRSRVIEATNVPRTIPGVGLYSPAPEAGVEPLGHRLIELTPNLVSHELRDPATEYVTYVPRGSIARGRALAMGDAHRGVKGCTTCHGPQLRGVGLVPPLAGRAPSAILRQLLAFRTGARASAAGTPMREMAATLSLDDMIAAAAFAGSLRP